jgi:thiol-disulfide isomerase/thioredoxin
MGMTLVLILALLIAQVIGGRDFYKILGIAKNAKDADIKRAYRKLSREWHPDQNPDNKEEATQMFYDISEAYEVLTDPEKRSKYDLGGEEALNGGGQGGPGGHGFQRGDPFDQFRTFFQFFGGEGGPGGFPGGGFPGGGGFHHQQAPQNMYDDKSGVTELGNMNDFNTHINQRTDIVIVDFYSPTCGPCRDLKSEYISIAKTFSGIVKVFAVNCQGHQAGQICKSQHIQNYPTIRMYGDNRSQIDFPPGNDRSSKTIGNWISNNIPDFTTKIDSEKKLTTFIKSAGSKAIVFLFSDKKQTPALFKSLCRSFKTNIACGILLGYTPTSPVAYVPASLTSQVDKTPFLYYLHDAVSFEGEKFKGSMSAEILSLFFSRIVSHKSRQVSVAQLTADRGEDCSPADATTCVLLLRQPTENGVATHAYEVMKRLAERYKSDPVKFFWVDPLSKFVSLFDTDAVLVAYRGKRGKYSAYEGEDVSDFDSVNSWIDNIVTGGSALKSSIARKARHDEL